MPANNGIDFWWLLGVGTAVFLTLTIGIVTVVLLHHRRTKRMLTESEAMREQLSQLSQQMLRMQEEERIALSRELHDDIGPHLVVLDTSLEAIRKGIKGNGAESSAQIQQLQDLTRTIIQKIRAVIKGLRPVVIEQIGLCPAIVHLTKEFANSSGTAISFLEDEFVEQLTEAQKIAIYRIIQESLTNIAKHAHAQNVEVELSLLENVLLVRIEDDGVGFDSDSYFRDGIKKQGRCFGLLGMRERAKSLGADFEIDSRKEHGTKVMLTFHLKR